MPARGGVTRTWLPARTLALWGGQGRACTGGSRGRAGSPWFTFLLVVVAKPSLSLWLGFVSDPDSLLRGSQGGLLAGCQCGVATVREGSVSWLQVHAVGRVPGWAVEAREWAGLSWRAHALGQRPDPVDP